MADKSNNELRETIRTLINDRRIVVNDNPFIVMGEHDMLTKIANEMDGMVVVKYDDIMKTK